MLGRGRLFAVARIRLAPAERAVPCAIHRAWKSHRTSSSRRKVPAPLLSRCVERSILHTHTRSGQALQEERRLRLYRVRRRARVDAPLLRPPPPSRSPPPLPTPRVPARSSAIEWLGHSSAQTRRAVYTQILEGETHTQNNKGDKRADTQTVGYTRDTGSYFPIHKSTELEALTRSIAVHSQGLPRIPSSPRTPTPTLTASSWTTSTRQSGGRERRRRCA